MDLGAEDVSSVSGPSQQLTNEPTYESSLHPAERSSERQLRLPP